MNLILIGSIAWMSYEIAKRIIDNNTFAKINNYIMNKNEEYYNELLKYYEKNKKVKITTKLNLLHRINIMIDRAGMRRSILINPIMIVIISVIIFFISYVMSEKVFQIKMLSVIISIPTVCLPFFILSTIANYNEQKIEKLLLNFLLQLKNYTKINNDIVYAFQEVRVLEPLQSYVDKFLLEVKSGIKLEIAIEHLKEKIQIKNFRTLLNHIQHCFLYGGNFSELIEKSYQNIGELQKEKAKRMQETRSARLVLIVLIILDLFVYFTFVNNNYENYKIMQDSIIGKAILYWNFISIWLLTILSYNVKKLDY